MVRAIGTSSAAGCHGIDICPMAPQIPLRNMGKTIFPIGVRKGLP
jgi:hypothetical protein